jgi:glucokinase
MAIQSLGEVTKPYVVISGLPGSGKSTLARRLAPLLNLPVIDKDDSLERLFEIKGTGDAAWRRALSRESDQLFQEEAFQARGAILVSFWLLTQGRRQIGLEDFQRMW